MLASGTKSAAAGAAVICSILDESVVVPRDSIVEFSRVEAVDYRLPSNFILSNCHVGEDIDVDLPPDFLFHTIPLLNDGGFVTVAFGVGDDLKRVVAKSEPATRLPYGGGGTVGDLFASDETTMDLFEDGKQRSLWFAKLFPRCPSMRQSFLETARIVSGKRKLGGGEPASFCSMDACLKNLNKAEFLRYRQQLRNDVSAIREPYNHTD